MAVPQYTQRRALGRRYSQDPAQQDWQRELELLYSMKPGQEARALQESQFQRSQTQTQSENEKQRKAAAEAGWGQMGTNLATTGMLGYMLGPSSAPKVPPTVPTVSPAATGITASQPAYTYPASAPELGYSAPAQTAEQYYGGTYSGAYSPATTDATLGAGEAGVGGATETGMGATSYAPVGYAAAAIAAGGMAYNQWGEKGVAPGDKTARQSFFADPISGMPSYAAGKWFGTDSKLAAPAQGMLKAKEEAFAKPIGKIMEGDIGGGAMDILAGPINATKAAIYEPIKKACGIIMTSIHGADSPEVELCRRYRNKMLTDEQLRGYYVFAEPICFIMHKHPHTKKYFRKYLTDSFVDYASYKLGEKNKKPLLKSIIISRVFLWMCSVLGRKVPVYVRLNGEVV